MTQAPNIAGPRITGTGEPPRGYDTAREVKARAAVSRRSDTPEQQKALLRLAQVLGTGEPPRTDVPRGYYLNIQV